jgi:putative spermidine/putrescine transport system ATP-binding protein
VALARAIVYAPKIILMDEPLGALDRQLREQMQDEIRRLHRETGTTFVNVTHDQQEALTMSDRIALLTEGRLQQIGTPDQLYTAPNSRFTATFMGAANIFPAFVVATAGRPTLRSPLGTIFTGEAAFAMRPGEEVEVLVRPEQVPIEAASQNKELNAVNGVLRETVRLGSAQRHWFDVPGFGDCIVDQFRSATCNSLQVGQDYQLHWDYADCRVLKG